MLCFGYVKRTRFGFACSFVTKVMFFVTRWSTWSSVTCLAYSGCSIVTCRAKEYCSLMGRKKAKALVFTLILLPFGDMSVKGKGRPIACKGGRRGVTCSMRQLCDCSAYLLALPCYVIRKGGQLWIDRFKVWHTIIQERTIGYVTRSPPIGWARQNAVPLKFHPSCQRWHFRLFFQHTTAPVPSPEKEEDWRQ